MLSENLLSTVFTFRSDSGKRGETPFLAETEKRTLLENMGVSLCVCPDFADIKEMSGDEFFRDVLVGKLNAGAVCVGEDFRFGKNAAWGVNDLKKMCDENGVKLRVSQTVLYNGNKISTTMIRNLQKSGKTDEIRRILGR